jgi:hypothetical protein
MHARDSDPGRVRQLLEPAGGRVPSLLEEELRRRVADVPGLGLVQHASGRIAAAAGAVSIGGLCEDAVVSATHLAHWLKQIVGITPSGSRAPTGSRRSCSASTPPRRSTGARAFAGDDRIVDLAAGQIGGQALRLGLVDRVVMNVVPVVFGSGRPFFGAMGVGDVVPLDNPPASSRATV